MKIRGAVLPIIGATIVMYLLQMFIPGFTEAFMLISDDIWTRPWILITSIFLHSPVNPSHIIFNMYGVYLFGSLLEQHIGPKRFILLYLGSGLIAGFIGSFFYQAALGASGALYGVIGALVVLMPNLRLLFFFVIPMTLRMLALVWVALDLFGFLSSAVVGGGGIGHAAHLAGIAAGFTYGKLFHKKRQAAHQRVFHKKPKKGADAQYMDEDQINEYLKHGRL